MTNGGGAEKAGCPPVIAVIARQLKSTGQIPPIAIRKPVNGYDRVMSNGRSQFTTRQLLTAATLVGLLCGSGAIYGLPGIVLFVATVITLACAWKSRRRTMRFALMAIASFFMWFMLVHRVIEDLECPICGLGVVQDRIELFTVGFVLREERHVRLLDLVACDFGCPCSHSRLVVLNGSTEDYWGLVLCLQKFPGTSGLAGIDEEWYREVVQPIVLKIRREEPELVRDFCREVIQKGNREYWIRFMNDKLVVACPQILYQ